MATRTPTTTPKKLQKTSKSPSKETGSNLESAYVERQGDGGELHQIASDPVETLTTQQGIPVADDQNTLRQGARGPALLEDAHFREKIFHSIMNGLPSAWFTHGAMARTAFSSSRIRWRM